MIKSRMLRPLAAAILITGCSAAMVSSNGSTSQEPVLASNLPLKYTARPTVAAITPADLMSRLYVFADDSMLGRQVGFEGNLKGTTYIADEARRIGLVPAGETARTSRICRFTRVSSTRAARSRSETRLSSPEETSSHRVLRSRQRAAR